MINMELSFIATEILKAASMHRKGMPFKAAKELSTDASFYFSACFDGRARLGACVTVSPSPQHGFETFFSLDFAEKLAKCSTPLRKVKPISIAKALSTARKEAKQAEDDFNKTNHHPAGAKQWRVYMLRLGAKVHTAETLVFIQGLADACGTEGPEAVESKH